jgi:hypothetical protein
VFQVLFFLQVFHPNLRTRIPSHFPVFNHPINMSKRTNYEASFYEGFFSLHFTFSLLGANIFLRSLTPEHPRSNDLSSVWKKNAWTLRAKIHFNYSIYSTATYNIIYYCYISVYEWGLILIHSGVWGTLKLTSTSYFSTSRQEFVWARSFTVRLHEANFCLCILTRKKISLAAPSRIPVM